MSVLSRRDWLAASAAAVGGAVLGPARRAAAIPARWDAAAAADSLGPPPAARADTTHVRRPAPRSASLATPTDGDRPSRVVTPNGAALTGRRAADGA